MIRRLLILAVVAVFFLSACVTHTHVVGNGAQKGEEVSEAQWYLIAGLLPLNEVDTNEMAGGAEDYTIVTQYTPLDAVISAVGSIITLQRRTVTVKK